MKFIELHNGTLTWLVNPESIEMIEPATMKDRPKISSYIHLKSDCGCYVKETPEEILQKIAEVTQSERVEIFQKFAEAEQRERSFMDDWKNEVDEQLGRLTVRKDGDADATDRC